MKKIFVVHGRNKKINDAMFSFLRSIGLEPMEWGKAKMSANKGSPFIGEILDAAFSAVDAILVLFTPDEDVKLKNEFIGKTDDNEILSQSRPNVLFEAGMAMGYRPNRTILVEVGDMRPFSDIAGRHIVRLDNSSESRMGLVQALQAIGMEVDIEGKTGYLGLGVADFSIDTNLPKLIDLSSHVVFHNPSDAQTKQSFAAKSVYKNFIVIDADFRECKPAYTGYAVFLGNDNWREFYQNGNHLVFSLVGNLSEIILEVKGEGQCDIHKRNIPVSPHLREYRISLKEMSPHASVFEKMTQIVFLLTPELLSEKATFEVRDLRIEE